MADVSKLRGRAKTLGIPPSPETSSGNLDAPEHAPAHSVEEVLPSMAGGSRPTADSSGAETLASPRIDGRTLRKSNRTVMFATRVTPAFDAELRRIAQQDQLLLVEVLEKALAAYLAARKP